MIYLYAKVDTSDGDYVTSLKEITLTRLEIIQPVIDEVKAFEPYTLNGRTYRDNYPTEDCVANGEKNAKQLYGHLPGWEVFDMYLPEVEMGMHTIKEIRIMYVTKEERLV